MINIQNKNAYTASGVPYVTFVSYEDEGSLVSVIVDHINSTFCGTKNDSIKAVVYAGKTKDLPLEVKEGIGIRGEDEN